MSFPGLLPTPPAGDPEASRAWVARQLGDLSLEGRERVAASPRFRGGQSEADRVLGGLDITRYAAARNQVLPETARGASAVSPYVRHGLISLRALWDHVADAPSRDRAKYRDELLWQEYARHLYARVGRGLAEPLRRLPAHGKPRWDTPSPAEMACMRETVTELEPSPCGPAPTLACAQTPTSLTPRDPPRCGAAASPSTCGSPRSPSATVIPP